MQNEFIGYNSIDNLRTVLLSYKPKNIFLVTSSDSYSSCGAEEIFNNLLKEYNFSRFYDFSPNIDIKDVEKGVNAFKKTDYDLIVAIGGGSVIDMAKLINIMSFSDIPINDFLKSTNKLFNKQFPLIAIPTTSGSGSEATHFAVLYKDKIKYSIDHKDLLPDTSIVDPVFSLHLPQKITADTGVDALSQAIESYWSIHSTEESLKYAKEAIKLIIKSLPSAVNTPDLSNRNDMALAAHLAGKAINITKTTAPHAISYPFTSYYGISHGHAVALTLPEILVYNFEVTENDIQDKRGCDYAKQKLVEIASLFRCKDVYTCKKVLNEFLQDIKIERSFKKLNITDIDIILDNVNTERLGNNPRKLTRKNLENILLSLQSFSD